MEGDDEADEDAPYADSLYDSAGGFEIRKEDDVEDVADILQPQETLAAPNGEDVEHWL